MIEISSAEQFKEYRSKDGYFVVKDITGIKIHVTRCPDVDIANFNKKVIENSSKNGGYYYFEDVIDANEKLKPKKCENCRRLM
ncbi:hypothetical protein EBB07_28935 [Paenibacillaceae bacterium]|nr:hypothetical protein EBB07_28935 [Paenibacillaceae bacterium]